MKPTDFIYSDFWLDEIDDFNKNLEDDENSLDLEMIRLASARRAIGNFIHILTNKQVPIYFNNKDANLTDGKNVYLGADIVNKEDFDPAVGLALHEGSHILLSDFDMLKTLWGKIPIEIYNITDGKNISKEKVIETVKFIWNIIEDRYIDDFVYKNAPGYRGYYIALYDKYFNSSKIDELLKSDMYREPSIDAYTARICNFININTDLNALPELRKIAQMIDLKNIGRLTNPSERFDLAFEVSKVVFTNVTDNSENKENSTFTSGDTTIFSEKAVGIPDEKRSDSPSDSKLDDVLGGEKVDSSINDTPDKSKDNNNFKTNDSIVDNKGDTSKLSQNKIKQIIKAIEKQKNFLNGEIKKKNVSNQQRLLLEAIEKSGMTIEKVGQDLFDNIPNFKGIDCVVVKNMTKDLICSDTFPMKAITFDNQPYPEMDSAVKKGVIMGNKLGTKLLLRNETNVTKFMRKSSGKIDKRTIAELGFENEQVFYSNISDKYNNTFIHISVDASSSMSGKKWQEAITTVVAICKACSMVENIDVSVSFRTTISSKKTNYIPYVVVAYDSTKDKFSKITNLFPYLTASGTTPEGLAFEATLNCFKESTQDKECYFLNLSDGEPYMIFESDSVSYNYSGKIGCDHTRKQVFKIKEKGYNVLSYYITSNYDPITGFNLSNTSLSYFKKMYGRDASFINTKNINMIAKSLNEMFLKKD
jgi:hypothetical protein